MLYNITKMTLLQIYPLLFQFFACGNTLIYYYKMFPLLPSSSAHAPAQPPRHHPTDISPIENPYYSTEKL